MEESVGMDISVINIVWNVILHLFVCNETINKQTTCLVQFISSVVIFRDLCGEYRIGVGGTCVDSFVEYEGNSKSKGEDSFRYFNIPKSIEISQRKK